MKIVVIGATGTIGSHIIEALNNNGSYEIIRASRNDAQHPININSLESIHSTFENIGPIDGVVNACGQIPFKPFDELSHEDWYTGIQSRLMGQINIAREAVKYLNKNGSITLTSGIIADHPIKHGLCASTLNGALSHFVKAAALEMPNHIRINLVSPGLVTESVYKYKDFFPGFESIDASKLANVYVRSILGVETGKTFKAYPNNF